MYKPDHDEANFIYMVGIVIIWLLIFYFAIERMQIK